MRQFVLVILLLTFVGCAKAKLEPPKTSAEPGIYRVSDSQPLDDPVLPESAPIKHHALKLVS